MKDTIAAISTPQAPGGLGVLRISGEDACKTADKVFTGVSGKSLAEYKGYTAGYGIVNDEKCEKIDDAVALVFRAPKSYTGEDTVEISCHGGMYVMHTLLDAVIKAGARIAEPGEFTKRAFLNGKMDLTQAESVMQIIHAGGEQAAKEAVSASEGSLSKKLFSIRGSLTNLMAHLAAWADFPEEDVPQVEERELIIELAKIQQSLSSLVESYSRGQVFREGVTAVIAGKTNAGKSTLMNLLSGCEKSIVTHIPGTTRDVVEDTISLAGVPVRIADTAGIRDTDDVVEKIGVEKSWKRMENAGLVIAVFDSSVNLDKNDEKLISRLNPQNTIAVINKTDLKPAISADIIKEKFPHIVQISAQAGEGLSELETAVSNIFKTQDFDPHAGTLYTKRQESDAADAAEKINEAVSALEYGMTLDAVTVCIEEALNALYRLTGEKVSDEVVNQVFDRFCVGK